MKFSKLTDTTGQFRYTLHTSELKPQHQIHFSIKPRVALGAYLSADDVVHVFMPLRQVD